jgi:hypothetical protein
MKRSDYFIIRIWQVGVCNKESVHCEVRTQFLYVRIIVMNSVFKELASGLDIVPAHGEFHILWMGLGASIDVVTRERNLFRCQKSTPTVRCTDSNCTS